jgi:hypothetical protein
VVIGEKSPNSLPIILTEAVGDHNQRSKSRKGGPPWKDRGDALARAHDYLDRGQPDLALQVVAEMPVDGPGAAEGLTLDAQAFLTRGSSPRRVAPWNDRSS